MQVQISKNIDGTLGDSINVSETVFSNSYNEPLIHQVLIAYMAGSRAGTKTNKSRSDVRGGGIKPWRQKGTGRARAGSIRSPIWRGGGVTFAARPRSFKQKVNRKMYSAAMRSIVSELLRQERLKVVDEITISAIKTKELIKKLIQFNCQDVLIITKEDDNDISLASRNVPNVSVIDPSQINPLNLLMFKNVLITVDALKQVEEKLGD